MVRPALWMLAGAAALAGLPMLRAQPPESREDAYRANNTGVAYLEQYDYQSAVKSFRRALDLDSSLRLARINLAIASLYAGDLEAARREAEAALAAAPASPHVHYILGLIGKSENRVEDAMAAFARVIEMDDRDAGARVHLAQLHLQQREYEQAAALLRPVIQAEPYQVTALYTLALSLTRAGQTEEGRRIMAEFQRVRDAGYATAFSNNYLEQGHYAEAIASTGAEPELVDPAPPRVRFAVLTRIAAAPGAPRVASSRAHTAALGPLGRGTTLADYDRDGDLDLLDVSSGTLRVFENGRGRFTDVTAKLGVAQPGPRFVPVAMIAADVDNDERPDLFVLGAGGHALYRQTESSSFQEVTAAAGIPQTAGFFRSAAFVDIDHDGDLDLFLVGTLADGGEPLPDPEAFDGLPPLASVLLRNNGNGTFTDITAGSKLAAPLLQGYAVVPADYDNRRDVDLLVAGPGRAPVLFKNLRDGSFRDVAADAGLPGAGRYTAIAAADLDKDDFTDVFLGRAGAPALLMLSDGRGGFREAASAPAVENVTAAQFVDVDNDGMLDLVAIASGRLQVWRNLGRGWADATTAVVPDGAVGGEPGERLRGLAAGDLDGDGDTDLVVKTAGGDLVVLENQGGSSNRSLTVRLTGRVSNRSAVGARAELRAGSLRQRLEVSSAWPAPAPPDLVFGLGTRAQADVVRVLWPAGILQSEVMGRSVGRVLALTELDRKPSSCPYLFTWNGERFEFLTDFMGGGEMGYAFAPGVWNTPDPEEYTRISGDRLKPRDGRYEIRVTNELEEALFLDRLQLVAMDHPAHLEVHPLEGLFAPPFPEFRLFTAGNIRPPLRATDHAGRDVLERVRHLDRRFVDDLPLERIRGYAKEHALTLDTGPSEPGAPVLLLLTGWTDYAFSSDNIAAHQAGLKLVPPSLQVRNPAGQWTTVVPEVGIPVGRPQTVVVDLTGRFLSGSREVRIVTTMRVYWDRVRVARGEPVLPRLTRLDPVTAGLRWRGFSAEETPDGREPFTYDYARVSPHSPWKMMPGRYTREGDVRELLLRADDMFVVSRPGDEIAVAFDAAALATPPEGWTRTFLLYSVGYSKEMDRNSASPDQLWPLPFRAMTRYPYRAPERYPQTPEHREYLERWNTRIVRGPVPPIELRLR